MITIRRIELVDPVPTRGPVSTDPVFEWWDRPSYREAERIGSRLSTDLDQWTRDRLRAGLSN